MFYIKSYILKPWIIIDDLDEVTRNPLRYFVEIDNQEGIAKLSNEMDFQYIDGAIVLRYFDQVIMDFRLWDLIDQLWAYFLNIIEEFIQEGKAQTHFPDSSIELILTTVSDDLVMFQINANNITEWTLPKKEFFYALLNAARYFFKIMNQVFKDKVDYNYQLNRIEKLVKKIN